MHFPNDLSGRSYLPQAKVPFTNEYIAIGKFDSTRNNAVVEFGISKSPDLSREVFVIWVEDQLVGELQLKNSGLLLMGATIAKKEHLAMVVIGKIGVMHTIKNGRRITSISCRVAKAINQIALNCIVSTNWRAGLGSRGAVVDYPDFVVEVDRHKNQVSTLVINDPIGMHSVASFGIEVVIDVNFTWVLANRSIGSGRFINILHQMLNAAPLPNDLIRDGIDFNQFFGILRMLGLRAELLGFVQRDFFPDDGHHIAVW